jgi:hypothetical protein
MANNSDAAANSTPASKTPLVDEIGTLTYPRAVQRFGKDKAIAVMHKVAEIGGHGMFEEAEFKSPLFGGLGMPSPENTKPPQKMDYEHLPESEFWYQSALEEFEGKKKDAADRRLAINKYYASLK